MTQHGTEVLYTAEEVRRAVRETLRAPGRRVVVVGFVGAGSQSYLPRPKGIELYCWPSPAATSAQALRKLMKLGVKVHFADRLHAKVYWSASGGAVVASANLSTNAYGAGGLKEFGVRLPAGSIAIDDLVRSLDAKPATNEALKRLELANVRARGGAAPGAAGATYDAWYEKGPKREDWFLVPCTGSLRPSKRLVHRVRRERQTPRIEAWVGFPDGVLHEDDWLLLFDWKKGRVSGLEWFHTDYVARIPRSDRAYDPETRVQAAQVSPLRVYRSPPFKIDRAFRRVFESLVREMLGPKLATIPVRHAPRRLLEAIYARYIGDGRRGVMR